MGEKGGRRFVTSEKEERTCDCCGEIGAAYMTLADAGGIFFTVCFRCISGGIRWLVKQGSEIKRETK